MWRRSPPDRAGGTVDPVPLCPIGTTPTGHQVLVDLERHGAITVAGDPEATIGLLRSVVLAMATVRWAAASQLTPAASVATSAPCRG